MPRILIAECKQEVSSFNPVLSHYHDFEILSGQDLLSYHRDSESEVGGALKVFDNAEVELVPSYSARAITSGGILAQECFERICKEFRASLQTSAPIDGVYFCLHGAMSARHPYCAYA